MHQGPKNNANKQKLFLYDLRTNKCYKGTKEQLIANLGQPLFDQVVQTKNLMQGPNGEKVNDKMEFYAARFNRS